MGEPPQSHYYVVYIAFTFRVWAFHTWTSLCFLFLLPFPLRRSFNTYYVLVDALLFMTGCVAIQVLNIPPNLMSAHSRVHCGRGASVVGGE